MRDGRTGLGVARAGRCASRCSRSRSSLIARAGRRALRSPPRLGVLAARALLMTALPEARVKSPLSLEPLFQIGPVAITEPVVVSWAVIAALGLRLGAGDPPPQPHAVEGTGDARTRRLDHRQPDPRHDAGAIPRRSAR